MPTRDDKTAIPVDGDAIQGTFVAPSTRLPGVLFMHGWGGSQEHYLARARESAALGCICLTFDFRGHAETLPQRETVSRENNLQDALAAYDALVRHPQVDSDSIAVVGSSYGGYLAAILTTLRPVRWLGLRVPALYMDSGWDVPKTQLHKDQDLDTYRRSLIQARDNRALQACAGFEGDVLIVESEHDTIVPHEAISNYLEAFIKPRSLTYRVIAGADHGLSEPQHQRAYTALLVNWLEEMIFGARAGALSARAQTAGNGAMAEAAPRPG
ncbi:alpha/beta fold hydrolase [Oxalobacteraceae bacterium OM1]|nr:alpha/beta fold hydrolase [Oxalobacteraceae bacterium OM1]